MNISWNSALDLFRAHGVTNVVAKLLAENDNSKQQIYLGKGFEAITVVPFDSVRADNSGAIPNFKAPLQFFWATPDGQFANAPFTQLILYPDYPEVRLSGFLRSCAWAPSEEMRPVPSHERGEKGAWDGRVLLMGTTPDRKVLSILASKGSEASHSFPEMIEAGAFQQVGVLWTAPLPTLTPGGVYSNRDELLRSLQRIHGLGWVPSQRMYADGSIRPYEARNGGGYTLEALLAVRPNGRSEPDYLGWEIKAYSQSRVTLMTPEPDAGFYGKHGVDAFVRRYGRQSTDDVMYFTGVHKVGQRNVQTGQTLSLEGYDAARAKITDVNGGIYLSDHAGEPAAIWSYPDLISHWGRKHANAAYMQYEKRGATEITFRYLNPVRLGSGTDFTLYLQAMHNGFVMYDPGCKVTLLSDGRSRSKARNQFRMNVTQLSTLYHEFKEWQL